MNIKDYLKRNGMTLILLVGMIILYLCIDVYKRQI